MFYVLLILAGFLSGYLVAREQQRRRGDQNIPQPHEPAGSLASLPEDKTSASAPLSIETQPEALGNRLHRLSQPLESFGDNSAHPNQLTDRDEFKEASTLLADPDLPGGTVLQYALGANWTLACAAFDALCRRDDRDDYAGQVTSQIAKLRPWTMHFALQYLLSLSVRMPSGAAVVGAEPWWNDNLIIPGLYRSYFSRLEELGDAPDFGTWLQASVAGDPADIERFLKGLNHPFATALIGALKTQQAGRLDRTFLEGFGRFWSRTGADDPVVEPSEWKDLLDAAERSFTLTPTRSRLVHGEAKVGKSAFLKLLGNRMMAHGWTIFEAGGPELQAGQSYIGQLEERVQRVVSELVATKKVIWYVPDILQIAISGTHSGQTASILDQVLPSLTSGRMIIISETTPAQLTQLIQLKPNLRGVFEASILTPLSEVRTREIVQSYADLLAGHSRIAIASDVVPTALQLARQYLDITQLPGVVFDLVKLAYNHTLTQGATSVTARDVLAALSQVSGLPKSILDADEKVELATVRRYFDERVMGQPEAVGHVVDRIAMLKAGLTDSTKPIGVFLFAGPTGTGKTELAKTLAQFLFGSSERLIRLDMSEFKTHDAISKVIGESGSRSAGSDSLINRVRKQPFSVVLLDEFEKAHPNVWDLFLQVFDDGRLTDANGLVADFRHCIIILTSNLGATAHQSSGFGFGQSNDVFSQDQVLDAIRQAFRPEFVNRLDKVIVFQPLSRSLMREILHKELRNVLERRGLRNREWAVEWEASAIEFLLDKGFSAQLGARPVKRAIDQYLLAPLAATIVEHRVPEGDQFLFVRSDGRAIQVEFVDPDADRKTQVDAAPRDTVELAGIVLTPMGSAAEHAAVMQETRLLGLRLESEEWTSLWNKLALAMADGAFWSSESRLPTLARYALMDRVKAAAKTMDALAERLEKSRDRSGRYSPQLMGRLARQVMQTKAGALDALANAPVECIVKVDMAFEGGGGTDGARDWCDKISGMYRGWAARRGMQLSEHVVDGATHLAVSGFGAHRTLVDEAGLHVLDSEEDEGSTSRCVARVRVAPSPPGELKGAQGARRIKAAIDLVPVSQTVVRRYREGSSPLVRDAKRGWRSGKLDAVLQGDFDLIGMLATDM